MRSLIAAVFAAVLPICTSVTSVQTRAAPIASPSVAHPYASYVAEAARRFGIPEAWIWAVMRVESAGDAQARSPAGAMGLMQVMPATWAELRARYGLSADPFDVRDNIIAGAAYLRAMYDRYGSARAMLAAYNAGPGRYDDYVSRGRPLPPETLGYLARLAPIVRASDATTITAAAPPDPFAWRRAVLFVRSTSAASQPIVDAPATAEQPSARQLSDRKAAVVMHSPMPTDMLFIRRVNAGGPR